MQHLSNGQVNLHQPDFQLSPRGVPSTNKREYSRYTRTIFLILNIVLCISAVALLIIGFRDSYQFFYPLFSKISKMEHTRLTTVKFRVHCDTRLGEHVHVVGNRRELGNWRPSAANQLKWTEHSWWEAKIPLAPGECEYKYVITEDYSNMELFEQGDNRTIVVQGLDEETIVDVWNKRKRTASTTFDFPTTSQLRIMSFNIRYDNPHDGPFQWKHRKDKVASIVSFHQADIAGLQEALSNQVDVSCTSVAKDPEA
jgi:hypothetical protein